MEKPTQQHYKRPWLWGRYFLAYQDYVKETDLMSKRAALRYLKSCQRYGHGYGLVLQKRATFDRPNWKTLFGAR